MSKDSLMFLMELLSGMQLNIPVTHPDFQKKSQDFVNLVKEIEQELTKYNGE